MPRTRRTPFLQSRILPKYGYRRQPQRHRQMRHPRIRAHVKPTPRHQRRQPGNRQPFGHNPKPTVTHTLRQSPQTLPLPFLRRSRRQHPTPTLLQKACDPGDPPIQRPLLEGRTGIDRNMHPISQGFTRPPSVARGQRTIPDHRLRPSLCLLRYLQFESRGLQRIARSHEHLASLFIHRLGPCRRRYASPPQPPAPYPFPRRLPSQPIAHPGEPRHEKGPIRSAEIHHPIEPLPPKAPLQIQMPPPRRARCPQRHRPNTIHPGRQRQNFAPNRRGDHVQFRPRMVPPQFP